MNGITIMIIAVPVLILLITRMGLDPIWWAILTICLVEIGLITPPFGLNPFPGCAAGGAGAPAIRPSRPRGRPGRRSAA